MLVVCLAVLACQTLFESRERLLDVQELEQIVPDELYRGAYHEDDDYRTEHGKQHFPHGVGCIVNEAVLHKVNPHQRVYMNKVYTEGQGGYEGDNSFASVAFKRGEEQYERYTAGYYGGGGVADEHALLCEELFKQGEHHRTEINSDTEGGREPKILAIFSDISLLISALHSSLSSTSQSAIGSSINTARPNSSQASKKCFSG